MAMRMESKENTARAAEADLFEICAFPLFVWAMVLIENVFLPCAG